ncbi:hypothetical protein FRC04_007426 [Tulasnella sp. 424]|nr:hypothetical protein FRC04_007426 [Tulasnella sp. 424]KAG8975121.1 hypothetical protein FRC05_006289 [Tulasnella sp. 425]
MDPQLTVPTSPTAPEPSDPTDIPPRTYLYARDGLNARIWVLSDEEARKHPRGALNEFSNSVSRVASIVAESTPNPFKPKTREHTGFDRIETGTNLGPRLESGERGPPDFYVQYCKEDPKSGYILWEGAGPQSEAFPNSKRLMDIQPESLFERTSIYTNPEEPGGRTARMSKPENAWLNFDRKLEDFDGVQYTFKTNVMDNWQCMRPDGTEMASWHRVKFSWAEIGLMDVKQSTPRLLLHLLLSAALIKSQQFKKREDSQSP